MEQQEIKGPQRISSTSSNSSSQQTVDSNQQEKLQQKKILIREIKPILRNGVKKVEQIKKLSNSSEECEQTSSESQSKSQSQSQSQSSQTNEEAPNSLKRSFQSSSSSSLQEQKNQLSNKQKENKKIRPIQNLFSQPDKKNLHNHFIGPKKTPDFKREQEKESQILEGKKPKINETKIRKFPLPSKIHSRKQISDSDYSDVQYSSKTDTHNTISFQRSDQKPQKYSMNKRNQHVKSKRKKAKMEEKKDFKINSSKVGIVGVSHPNRSQFIKPGKKGYQQQIKTQKRKKQQQRQVTFESQNSDSSSQTSFQYDSSSSSSSNNQKKIKEKRKIQQKPSHQQKKHTIPIKEQKIRAPYSIQFNVSGKIGQKPKTEPKKNKQIVFKQPTSIKKKADRSQAESIKQSQPSLISSKISKKNHSKLIKKNPKQHQSKSTKISYQSSSEHHRSESPNSQQISSTQFQAPSNPKSRVKQSGVLINSSIKTNNVSPKSKGENLQPKSLKYKKYEETKLEEYSDRLPKKAQSSQSPPKKLPINYISLNSFQQKKITKKKQYSESSYSDEQQSSVTESLIESIPDQFEQDNMTIADQFLNLVQKKFKLTLGKNWKLSKKKQRAISIEIDIQPMLFSILTKNQYSVYKIQKVLQNIHQINGRPKLQQDQIEQILKNSGIGFTRKANKENIVDALSNSLMLLLNK